MFRAARTNEDTFDLLERRIRPEQHRALGRLADADEEMAFLFESFSGEKLDGVCRRGVHDVDVDCRCEFGQDAGVAQSWINPRPVLDFFGCDIELGLPPVELRNLPDERNGREASGFQLLADERVCLLARLPVAAWLGALLSAPAVLERHSRHCVHRWRAA